ncbi:monovalent cation/H+ antiporter complex subunit F [Ornithinimicrobium cavernae]|uniref:monovalent cation/H+ antiporter complex subunit F n=1 Tax=Ornithinimicrobium cavernae TaxID=2666047 RepID=UPI000D69BFBF|nr:monovalent cation/H+ antiporter complex subunit F [Ornithinimicrobium cavernae]
MGFSEIMTWAIGILLVSASLLSVVRIITGPSVLDRVVATDVLVSIVVCSLGAQTALVEGSSTMPLLITLSLVGFMGSVAVARFVARDRDYPVDFDEPDTVEEPGRGEQA